MSAAIAERTANGSPFVVLAIDLDGLKQINDTLGHIAGDARIKEVADCIRRVVGARGAVHRTGGDEFMVILPGQRNIHGLAIARRIDQETRTTVGCRAVSIGLTESIAAEGRLMIVGQADLALYEAKRTRLNAVVFSPGLVKPVDAVGLTQASRPVTGTDARSPPRWRGRSTPRTSAPRATERPSRSCASRSANGSVWPATGSSAFAWPGCSTTSGRSASQTRSSRSRAR